VGLAPYTAAECGAEIDAERALGPTPPYNEFETIHYLLNRATIAEMSDTTVMACVEADEWASAGAATSE
jgi:hypothetical protein